MMDSIVREALARHREDPPPGLTMTVPIHHLMDRDFCGVVTSDLSKFCATWEKRLATPDLWKQLPAVSGVYMFVFASTLVFRTDAGSLCPSWVLYIGRAGSADSNRTIRGRYQGEYSKHIGKSPEALWSAGAPATRDDRMAQYLTIYPLQYWFTTMSDRSQIPTIEDRLIKLLAPMMNGRQLPHFRPQTPQAAFRSVP
ncbi:MAG: hypothetical protein ACREDL_05705 [Bradyrhizobium sp.]